MKNYITCISKKNREALLYCALALVVIVIACLVLLWGNSSNANTKDSETQSSSELKSEYGTETETGVVTETETESTIETETESTTETESATEKDPTTEKEPESETESEPTTEEPEIFVPNKDVLRYGIDVSKWQGTIDWEKVVATGIDFVLVRVGNRTLVDGTITEDPTARYNMQQASKYGIKVGVYFFSTAVTEAEAKEEADWVLNLIKDYKITYPVVYNCEGFEKEGNRQYKLSKSERTDLALVFMSRIAKAGYTPMFYASKLDMEQEKHWEMSRIEDKYKVWVAQYITGKYSDELNSGYTGIHAMWQYSNKGTISGIKGSVDLNVAYFDMDIAIGGGAATDDKVDIDALMNFKEVREEVTAKESTNLRDFPSQGDESKVMYTLQNGEIAIRTGVSDSGWSRVEYNGQVYYAVSSLLTTDLTVTPPDSDDEGSGEIKTQFTEVNEKVTAKEVVNLRNIPSTTSEDSIVVAQLTKGEIIVRTGINTDVGWSRVEYNGQVLYCVSSYLEVVEE